MWKVKDSTNGRANIVGAEIGVNLGEHAEEILNDWKEIKILHLVDNYSVENAASYGDARIKLEKFNSRIKWYIEQSQKASMLFDDNSLDFVYIDASHMYLDVLQDCIVWYKKVRVGGILCGHDYRKDWKNMLENSPSWLNSRGVVTAVNQFVRVKNQEFEINKENKKILLSIEKEDWLVTKC